MCIFSLSARIRADRYQKSVIDMYKYLNLKNLTTQKLEIV